jgi:hypothetical protein
MESAQSCHLSKLVGKIQEHELILARAFRFTFRQQSKKACGYVQNTDIAWAGIGGQ